MGGTVTSKTVNLLAAYLVSGVLGCAKHGMTPTGQTDPTQALRKCGEPPADLARLASYWNVKIPARYWIDLAFDGTEWTPPELLPMPPHHTTRLELADVPPAVASRSRIDERVRFTIEITSREIRPVVDRHQWRVTYHARVIDACVPAASEPPVDHQGPASREVDR